MFQWLKRQGGVAEMEKRAKAKAGLLYAALDANDFLRNTGGQSQPLAHERSLLPEGREQERGIPGRRRERGLLQLKGHKSVGGMRASIYNAMPIEGVQALVDYLNEFAGRAGQ